MLVPSAGQIRRGMAEMERRVAALEALPERGIACGPATEVALERLAALLPDRAGAAPVSPQRTPVSSSRALWGISRALVRGSPGARRGLLRLTTPPAC